MGIPLLNNDVAKLEDIVFKEDFNGVEDGILMGVQIKRMGDLTVSKT